MATKVGVSIDGPVEYLDRERRYCNGSGMLAKTFRSLETLETRGVPFHVISVLTIASLENPDAGVRFLRAIGL
jgi:uncharacterized protein